MAARCCSRTPRASSSGRSAPTSSPSRRYAPAWPRACAGTSRSAAPTPSGRPWPRGWRWPSSAAPTTSRRRAGSPATRRRSVTPTERSSPYSTSAPPGATPMRASPAWCARWHRRWRRGCASATPRAAVSRRRRCGAPYALAKMTSTRDCWWRRPATPVRTARCSCCTMSGGSTSRSGRWRIDLARAGYPTLAPDLYARGGDRPAPLTTVRLERLRATFDRDGGDDAERVGFDEPIAVDAAREQLEILSSLHMVSVNRTLDRHLPVALAALRHLQARAPTPRVALLALGAGGTLALRVAAAAQAQVQADARAQAEARRWRAPLRRTASSRRSSGSGGDHPLRRRRFASRRAGANRLPDLPLLRRAGRDRLGGAARRPDALEG